MLHRELFFALLGTGFACGATILGSGTVYFFKKGLSAAAQRVSLGFAAGVMTAASVWSLLMPAMDMAVAQGQGVLLPVGGGFLLGGVLLLALDGLLPHLHMGGGTPEGPPVRLKRTTMVMLAVTLHNIPEGMAVGLAFAIAAREGGSLPGAVALAIGMGLQNFPEGAAISLPLRGEGVGKGRSFLCGALSGIVEPVFGLLTVLASGAAAPAMPWVLSLAAGAMIYVVVEELVPAAHLGEHTHMGTVSVMAGFLVMMLLDVLLS